ncbi:MAG: M1 family aminopeptidase [Bacteroidota bacterium]
MKTLLQFEWSTYFKKPGFYIFLLLIIVSGVFAGAKFSLSISHEVFKNASYTIAYMIGMMSLLAIFFSTILVTQILFRETDAHFNLILYATPIRRRDYLLSRFVAVLSVSIFSFLLFVTGFALGQLMPADRSQYTGFNLSFYLQPLLVFGLVNTIFCTAILCSVAWATKSKLMVYVSGLFIYILYMVTLIFSGSPMMAQGMPQSATAIQLSACFDPFGLSAYFLQTSGWSVPQRNAASIPLSGTLLFNRMGVIMVSLVSMFFSFKTFSFSVNEKGRKAKRRIIEEEGIMQRSTVLRPVEPSLLWYRHWATMFSFTKLDLKYITRSIPFVLACVGLLFYLSMEIYGSIARGIRLPQKYATSGLMASTIIESFHGLCLIVILYYANEIVWRSRNSNFHLIENATPAGSASLFFSKWMTLSVLILFFTSLMIIVGIVFQVQYDYPAIDWQAYAGIFVFTSFPLIVCSGVILIIQKLIRYKHIGLVVSAIFILCTATSIGDRLLTHPLLRFLVSYKGLYSDINGFGSYMSTFSWLHLFGLCVVVIAAILITQVKRTSLKLMPIVCLAVLAVCGFIAALNVISDYQPKNAEAGMKAQAEYEKKFRSFQNQPQPTITAVATVIDLFTENNAYDVAARYTIQNKTDRPIDSILINFADEIAIKEAFVIHGNKVYPVQDQYTVIPLAKALLPGDTAQLATRFSYHWSAINGHQSFNAIVQNGSFMRISRWFPTVGYLAENEIENESERKKHWLGQATRLVTLEAPRDTTTDFINLDMTISTNYEQTAIGVGELVGKWQKGNRNYFQYRTPSPVPFRFAVSSARYAVKTAAYHGKSIEVYYHAAHYQNVDHLLKNARLTLDYCEANFGDYPFKTIRFAEVSAFTKGFAATAYPATIYMTEDMVFNADIGADKKQDVINELAGHEMAHFWWGNSQISPGDREGSVMLTETLAMYTELMLVKKVQGAKRVMEHVNMHLGMYLDERGFTGEQPLIKMLPGNVHLSYSKGLVVMHQLLEMVGEEKLNLALRNLLQHHAYPQPKPISTDFLQELYAVTDSGQHSKIDYLFKRITLYDFIVKNTSVKRAGKEYALRVDATVNKYYEDGRGGRTKSGFSDSVGVTIYFKDGKEEKAKLAIVNGVISATVLVGDIPKSLMMDPGIQYIKYKHGEQVTITNSF